MAAPALLLPAALLRAAQETVHATGGVAMPDRYVVIGNPVAHSKSPLIHARFAAGCGQSMHYDTLLAPLDAFRATVLAFRDGGGRGANVTVPFKLDAFALADELTPRAQAAQAVNTLRFDGKYIIGDNTDGLGLVRDIVRNAGVPLGGKRVLLMGAGGAARGALHALLQQAPLQIVIANRTLARAQELALQALQAQSALVSASTFEDLASESTLAALVQPESDGEAAFDVIINATSASLNDNLPALPDSVVSNHTLAYDMMYGARPTIFMQWAASHGAQVRDGLGMLVEQAAEAFAFWRGVRPDTQDVLRDLREALQ